MIHRTKLLLTVTLLTWAGTGCQTPLGSTASVAGPRPSTSSMAPATPDWNTSYGSRASASGGVTAEPSKQLTQQEPVIVRGQQPGRFGGQQVISWPGQGQADSRHVGRPPTTPTNPNGTVAYPPQSPVNGGVYGQGYAQGGTVPPPVVAPQSSTGLDFGSFWQRNFAQPVSQPAFTPDYPMMNPDEFANIEVDLAETQTGRFLFGVGVNSDAGLVGNIVMDEQNFDLFRWPTSFYDFKNGTAFRGAGQRFRLEAMPGTEVQRYSFNFSDPYLFGSPVSFGTSGFFYDRSFVDWDEQRLGGRLSLGYMFPQRPDLSTTVAVRAERITISDPSTLSLTELTEVLGDNDLYSGKWAVAHDTRDSTAMPTEGHMIQLSYEQVFGSFEYPKFTADARKYFVMHERPDGSGRHILGVSGKVGITGSDTPIYDRFYAGGFSTIRGFDFRGASPTKSGVITGGDLQVLTSFDYRFPLTANDQVFGSIFLDVGTVEDTVNIHSENIRVVPGVEVRVNIPQLGPIPIAIGLGFPVQHAPGDDIRNFHFYVGVSH